MQRNHSNNLMPVYFAVVLIVGLLLGYGLKSDIRSSSFLGKGNSNFLQEVDNLIKNKYVDDIGLDSINTYAVNELLSHLDPHSVYIEPSELQEVNEELEGSFTGIGVVFNVFKDTITITQVLPNGPAQKAGVQMGDKLLAIDDSIKLTAKNTDIDFAKSKIHGADGSKVLLTVLRNNALQKISVQRGSISVPSVDAAYMLNATTGYIKINKFGERTYEEFMEALENLQKQKMKSLVLDLRNNGGGFMHAATNIADEFLDGNKLIVYTLGHNKIKDETVCNKDGLFEKGKLTVLINEGTASASEVLAGALQDWDRATIIGRRSFGKGLVQQQYNLTNGGALRLTTARYYTPLGRNIQKPYTADKEKYLQEVDERYTDGELFTGDSALPKGKAYTTPNGRTVYGGGGITPDIFVPLDTLTYNLLLYNLIAQGVIDNFAFDCYTANKQSLMAAKNINDIEKIITTSSINWQQLQAMAKSDSINYTNLSSVQQQIITQIIQATIAKQLLNNNAYYQIKNENDSMLQKALRIVD